MVKKIFQRFKKSIRLIKTWKKTKKRKKYLKANPHLQELRKFELSLKDTSDMFNHQLKEKTALRGERDFICKSLVNHSGAYIFSFKAENDIVIIPVEVKSKGFNIYSYSVNRKLKFAEFICRFSSGDSLTIQSAAIDFDISILYFKQLAEVLRKETSYFSRSSLTGSFHYENIVTREKAESFFRAVGATCYSNEKQLRISLQTTFS